MQRRTFSMTGASCSGDAKDADGRGTLPPRLSTYRPQGVPASENADCGHGRRLAEELSRQPFVPPAETLPPDFASISYDQYRDIRFRPEQAVWHKERLGFELQFFISAYIYRSPVEIFLVEERKDSVVFRRIPRCSTLALMKLNPSGVTLSFSGLRIHAPLEPLRLLR